MIKRKRAALAGTIATLTTPITFYITRFSSCDKAPIAMLLLREVFICRDDGSGHLFVRRAES